MSEVEKLRALLAEARSVIDEGYDRGIPSIIQRIDAALAEPVAECARCETLRELADTAAAEQGLAQRRMMEAQRERDEARAEVETLRAAIEGEPWGGAVLKQQRDEAINRLGVTLEQLWAAEKERDEARAEVARLQKIVDDTALGINAMIQSALNHPANCPIYDNGRCTCGKEKP